MLKSFFDFGKAEVFYSSLEEYFKKKFKSEFGISVVQTLYEREILRTILDYGLIFQTLMMFR